jgi:RNA polymerase-interacting CarD/CdnL/TRCF family regulator
MAASSGQAGSERPRPKEGSMKMYSVGDKVVHPRYGPGQILSIESRDFLDGPKRYYTLLVPDQDLTVYFPVRRTKELGIRPAMSRSRLPEVLDTLGSRPRDLPQDYKERQQHVHERLTTGRVMQVAKVVRDLSWHRHRAHLTRKDTDYLKLGLDLLAAEMALACGDEIPDMNELIESTIDMAMGTL